jgi:hypothetical protein
LDYGYLYWWHIFCIENKGGNLNQRRSGIGRRNQMIGLIDRKRKAALYDRERINWSRE